MVNVFTLVGKLDPALISRHDKAQLFFRRCLWHKDRKVFLLFENAILGKEGWTGALLAPFCSLLIEAMEAVAGAGGSRVASCGNRGGAPSGLSMFSGKSWNWAGIWASL